MTLNELVAKQNVLNAILVKDGDKELNKVLKVKVVRLRIAYNKVKKQMDNEIKEFVDTLLTDDEKAIQGKPEAERTAEEQETIKTAVDKANAEYAEFVKQKSQEEVKESFDDIFTEENFDDIIDLNAGHDFQINDTPITSEALIEAFYTFFVNKD